MEALEKWICTVKTCHLLNYPAAVVRGQKSSTAQRRVSGKHAHNSALMENLPNPWSKNKWSLGELVSWFAIFSLKGSEGEPKGKSDCSDRQLRKKQCIKPLSHCTETVIFFLFAPIFSSYIITVKLFLFFTLPGIAKTCPQHLRDHYYENYQ